MDVPYFLSKSDADPLRFYLTATAQENRDSEACPEGLEGFSWEDFVECNNPHPEPQRRDALSRGLEPHEGASEGNELVAT